MDIDFDNLGSEEVEVQVEAKPVVKTRLVEDKKTDKFKNMKGISSTDYMYSSYFYQSRNGGAEGSSEVKDRLAKFSNAKGISSDDYYGVPKKTSKQSDDGILNKAKDVGYTIFESAKEKVSNVRYS